MHQYATGLVNRYRALQKSDSDFGGDDPTKANIIRVLDEAANEPDVSQLLLDVLVDFRENEAARVEAIEIARRYVNESSPLEGSLKRQVWSILEDTGESLAIRQRASERTPWGFGGEREFEIVEHVLFDDDDDIVVRRGVFRNLRYAPNSPFVLDLIPRLRAHVLWGQQCFDVRIENIETYHKERLRPL